MNLCLNRTLEVDLGSDLFQLSLPYAGYFTQKEPSERDMRQSASARVTQTGT